MTTPETGSAADPATAARQAAIPFGATIGVVGGGQLGRMTALAAARLGYAVHVLAPESDAPAAAVAARHVCAAYDDAAAIDDFAASIAVATCEFEHLPVGGLKRLADRVPLRPGWRATEVCQDRVAEKTFINAAGVATAAWRPVSGAAELKPALGAIGGAGILKTARAGYDGKGQVRIAADAEGPALEAAWRAIFPDPAAAGMAILEAVVPFEREVSAIVARGPSGEMAAFDVVENIHRDHILHTTIAPAPVSTEIAGSAAQIARRLAESLGIVGLLAVEMFITPDGAVVVNELAPRPHNSGHWTMDACRTDQFEQLVRAICGLPLGATGRLADARMVNLLGDDVIGAERFLAMPDAKLHLYGKREARPGRKMGHVTFVGKTQGFGTT